MNSEGRVRLYFLDECVGEGKTAFPSGNLCSKQLQVFMDSLSLTYESSSMKERLVCSD